MISNLNNTLDNLLESINKKKAIPLASLTLKSYKSRLNNLIIDFNLYNNNNIYLKFFINNYDDIINYLNKNIENNASKISYISSILFIILFFDDNKYIENIRIKYQNKIKELRDNINSVKNNEKNDKESENWIDYNELKNIFDDNYNKYINIINDKKIVKINDYYDIQNMVIFSFYILIEPVRSHELVSLKYKDYNKDKDNYIDIKNKKLIFNYFKTSKSKKQAIIDLKDNDKLINLIKSFILFKNNNGFNIEYLFNSNDGTQIDNSQIVRRLNIITGKKISSSMIRKIYLSHKYGDNLDMINNINNTAKNMMNSVNVITKNYIKK